MTGRDDRRTAVVGISRDVVAATAWRDLLHEAGITAQLVGGEQWAVYPGAAQISDYRIIVFEDDVARAREIIDRAEAGELALPDDD